MRTILFTIVIFSFSVKAELNVKGLGEESLNNTKEFRVNNGKAGGDFISVKIKARYKGEPAGRAVTIYPSIKCGVEKAKPIDIAGFLLRQFSDQFASYIGAPTKHYPNGVIQVCSVESVNFDSQNLFISFFDAGSSSCNRNEIVDFIIPLDRLCAN